MRFSHTADCHIGGHRDARLRELSENAFEQFVTNSLQDDVDFCLIAGDLFNTAIPGIDALKFVVTQLSRLKEKNIAVYAIPGSHDFSPSGKTMLDVLERASLISNVFKGETNEGKLKLQFTTDEKTGVKLTGILGKRGMLDKQLYKELDQSIANEPGEKIFLFHTAIEELTEGKVIGHTQPVNFLPKNFLYYAGGHVHIVERYDSEERKNVVYPGPLFPNSFSELEELEHGGYFLYDNGTITRKNIPLKPVVKIHLNVENKTSDEANTALQESSTTPVEDAIVLLRIEGTLSSGNPKDLDIRTVVAQLEKKGAHIVLRNTSKLGTKEFEQLAVQHSSEEDIEETILDEHKEQLLIDEKEGITLAKQLLTSLRREQKEGERKYEYEEDVVKETLTLLNTK